MEQFFQVVLLVEIDLIRFYKLVKAFPVSLVQFQKGGPTCIFRPFVFVIKDETGILPHIHIFIQYEGYRSLPVGYRIDHLDTSAGTVTPLAPDRHRLDRCAPVNGQADPFGDRKDLKISAIVIENKRTTVETDGIDVRGIRDHHGVPALANKLHIRQQQVEIHLIDDRPSITKLYRGIPEGRKEPADMFGKAIACVNDQLVVFRLRMYSNTMQQKQ